MQQIEHHIGIDISSETFTCSDFQPSSESSLPEDYCNNLEGFKNLESWFQQHQITPENSIICMEATGVYTEAFCYYFHHLGFQLVVESPKKTKRAFSSEDKNDAIDARQLGEYAFRFFDQLSWWSPRSHLVEQVDTLLKTREQLVKQKTMNQNLLHALGRKETKTPFAQESLKTVIQQLQKQIQAIEKEIESLFKQDPPAKQAIQHLKSLTGVQLLLAANFFVFNQGFEKPLSARHVCARLGIAPRDHLSGTSVKRKARSRREGHSRLRKLLYLAAMSLRTHEPRFKHYFLRKVEQGKEPALVLNNLENKLVKIMCALVNNKTTYDKNYQSINPALLNAA